MRTVKHRLVGVALCAALVSPVSAQAKDKATVMEHYRAYSAALKAGKTNELSKHAYAAWQAAEDAFGDSKMTGDLASNFGTNDYLADGIDYAEKRKALVRAVELAHFHGDMAADVEVQRRITLADHATRNFTPSFRGGSMQFVVEGTEDLSRLQKRIRELGLEDTSYQAEATAIAAKVAYMRENFARALTLAETSIAEFDNAKTLYPSSYPLEVRFYRARALKALDRPVEALLAYQDIMALMDKAGLDDQTRALAVADSQVLQAELEGDGRFAEAVARGFRPLTGADFEIDGEVRPLVRVPPHMPSGASRSGWVHIRFDVDAKGSPTNVRAVDASEHVFKRPALESVERWLYATGAEGQTREGVDTFVTFKLRDERGEVLPPKRPKPVLSDD